MDYFASDPIRVYLPVSSAAISEHYGDAPFKAESAAHPCVVLYCEPTGGGVESLRRLMTELTADEDGDEIERVARLVRRRIAVQAWRLAGDWRIYSHSWGEESPVLPDLTEAGALEIREALVARMPESHQLAIVGAVEGTDTVSEEEKKDSPPQ